MRRFRAWASAVACQGEPRADVEGVVRREMSSGSTPREIQVLKNDMVLLGVIADGASPSLVLDTLSVVDGSEQVIKRGGYEAAASAASRRDNESSFGSS